ncbi:MAG: DUF305 domain-containing protein [Actinomycetota bacterium]
MSHTTPTDEVDSDDYDDEPVSRWSTFLPASPRQWVALGAALLFLAGALGYYLGSRDSGIPLRDSVDVGFLQDMITHHEQAIQMALIENSSGEEPGLQTFAREIILFQSYEIGLMDRQLNQWGYRREKRSDTAMQWMGMAVAVDAMPGLASPNEMQALREHTGPDIDALWIKLMQDHHAGGVHMAEYAAEHASDPFVREIAARMARNQRIEIGELDGARERADLTDHPAGYGT